MVQRKRKFLTTQERRQLQIQQAEQQRRLEAQRREEKRQKQLAEQKRLNDIKEVQREIEKSDKREIRFKKDNNKSRRRREQLRQDILKDGLALLRQGKNVDIKELSSLASRESKSIRKKETAFDIASKSIRKKQIKTVSQVLLLAEEVKKKKPIKKASTLSKPKTKFDPKQIAKIKLPNVSKSKQSSFTKLAVKQTLTPKDVKNLKNLVKKEGSNLSKAQLEILKKAPKNVALGVYEVGKEVVVLGKDSLVNSFNYGRNLVKRYEKGESTPLNNDISKLATGTVAVGSFVANNPKKAAQITTMAVAAGATGLGNAFVDNPVKTTTKAALYLFPGTVIKGGVKTAQLSKNTVTSAIQAKRYNKLAKSLNPARKGLTTAQNKKLNSALKKAAKISNVNKQNTALRSGLTPVLKDRGINFKKGESVSNLVKKVAGSKDIIKVQKVTPKPKVTKPFLKFKGEKVTKISKKALPTPKLKKARDTTKFVVVEGEKIKKVTKKEFLSKQVKVKKPSKKQIAIDTEKAFNLELAQKGVIKKGGKTFIDLNAVNRIEKASVPIKPITRKGFMANKKGQVRFSRQVQVQIQKAEKVVKSKKKPSKAKLKKTKNDLIKLKTIVNVSRIAGFSVLISKINAVVKGIEKAIAQTPAKSPAKVPAKKTPQKVSPVKKPAKLPKKAPAKAVARPTPKPTPVKSKPVTKKPKVIKKPKAVKKPVKFKLPTLKFTSKLPRGSNLKYDIKFKEKGKIKTIKLGLPLNKAIKKGFGGVDRTTQASAQLVISGTTKVKDIASSSVKGLKSKFRVSRSKDGTALRFVEKKKNRIDTQGEKKGLKLSKALKKKKRK